MLGQLSPTAVAYSPRTGRTFSFVKWTHNRRWDPTDQETLAYCDWLVAERRRRGASNTNGH